MKNMKAIITRKKIKKKKHPRFENMKQKNLEPELLDSIRSILIFFRIFGVCPFKVVENEDRLRLRLAKGRKIHAALVVIICLGLVAVPLRQAYLSDNERNVLFVHVIK